ncbi:cyclin [Annulohypoxylon maeteangense]|uniref:cyclin n=1 Tax=Annulohypoxylon maeteangense TaxID=1927788 RepID=UPI00200726FE|nr:cyclin [Annulohypoxylon maeteangense]KAI0887923.1 cyclin [Annulohypoxylon maeteangense]
MSSTSRIPTSELNAAALEHFVYKPVSPAMIQYLAQAARDVIQCDPNMMPPPAHKSQYPSPPRTPSPKAVQIDDSGLPTLEEFITQLVRSSNVQVPTLMSTLVYLTRLRSRLQPMAKGLRCTTHRIFLATLILAAKYLNDSSPKNKHWATYSHMNTDGYSFGFSRTEVNLMEKQLLFLLEWELRISEEDLYRELDPFLAPIRDHIEASHARRMQRKEDQRKMREAQAWAAAASAQFPTPPSSRGSSRARTPPEQTIRMVHDDNMSPPQLVYSSGSSSSGSSYASSVSSRQHSRSSTPLSDPDDNSYLYDGSLYASPVEVVLDMPTAAGRGYVAHSKPTKQLLPYEISADDLRAMQDGSAKAKRARTGRGMWGRMFGGGIAVR